MIKENTKKQTFAILVVALVLVVISTYLIFHGARTEEAGVMKIGFINPLSGGLANIGEDIREGVALFESQHEDLKVIYEDDEFDPKKSLTAYRKLRDVDGVKTIIGPLGPAGTATIDGAMNADDRENSFVFPVSLCLDEFKEYENSLCSYPSLREQIKANLEFAESKGKKKVYLITERSPQGEETERLLNEEIALRDQEIVGTIRILDFSQETNFYSYVSQIKNSDADYVIISVAFDPNIFQLIKNMKEQGVDVLILMNADLEKKYAEEFSEVLEGVYIPALIGEDFIGSFESAYEAKFGEKPNLYNALGYELIAASYNVQKEKGSIDRDSLVDEISDSDYAIRGFSYDEDYMVQIPFDTRLVTGGKIVSAEDWEE